MQLGPECFFESGIYGIDPPCLAEWVVITFKHDVSSFVLRTKSG